MKTYDGIEVEYDEIVNTWYIDLVPESMWRSPDVTQKHVAFFDYDETTGEIVGIEIFAAPQSTD